MRALLGGTLFVTLLALCGGVFPCPHGRAAGREGEDWPSFLGPDRNNISAETGLIDFWGEAGPPVVWSKAVGAGYGAPSVRAGLLVLHHRVRDEEVVEAFGADTGKSVWRYGYRSSFVDPFGYNNGPRCTPLLTANRCYTFGAEGKLLCLDLQSGAMVWQRDTSRDWQVPEAFFGVGSTPLLEGGKLIVMLGGQPNAGVVALDPGNGKLLWESVGRANWQGVRTLGWRGEAPCRWTGEEKQASYSSPVAATIHGRRCVFCLMRQGLVGLEPATGAVWFSRWFQSQVNESVNAMCPVVWENQVLVSGAYYRIGAVLLEIAADGRALRDVWRSQGRGPDGEPAAPGAWSPVLEIHWTTPVLHGGYLYAFSGRNEPDASFRCVEWKTGKLRWSRDEQWRAHSSPQPPVYGRGSVILADGRLLVLGEGGKLGMFALDPTAPVEICAGQVAELHYPCWTAPVLSHRRLYLRSEDRLVCLDLRR